MPPLQKAIFLVPRPECKCNRAAILTWLQRSLNSDVNPDTEVCDGNCIQYARDPFFLLRYRVSSVRESVSKRVQADKDK